MPAIKRGFCARATRRSNSCASMQDRSCNRRATRISSAFCEVSFEMLQKFQRLSSDAWRFLRSHAGDDNLDQMRRGESVEDRDVFRAQTVRGDDVDQVPGGKRTELPAQQRLALFVDRKRIEHAFRRQFNWHGVRRGSLE